MRSFKGALLPLGKSAVFGWAMIQLMTYLKNILRKLDKNLKKKQKTLRTRKIIFQI